MIYIHACINMYKITGQPSFTRCFIEKKTGQKWKLHKGDVYSTKQKNNELNKKKQYGVCGVFYQY